MPDNPMPEETQELLQQYKEQETKTKNAQNKNQYAAKAFVENPMHKQMLMYVEEIRSFAHYDAEKGLYKILNKDEETSYFYRSLAFGTNRNITIAIVNDIVRQISFLTERRKQNTISKYLALKDGLLDTDTGETMPFDINKVAFYSLPLTSAEAKEAYSNNYILANCRFKKFLDEVLITSDEENPEPDKDLQALTQELFGYCLVPTTKSEATFFLKGSGSNGKGVVIELLEHLMGAENVSSTDISQLTNDRFAYADLIGKRVNLSTENEGEHVTSDKFKALISGDPVRIERKYGDSYTARLPIKYVFSTNDFPKFSGFDFALMRRIKILPFNKEFQSHERDLELKPFLKSEAEFKHVAMWALNGLFRLVKNHFQFTQPAQSHEALLTERNAIVSSLDFIFENYEPGGPVSFISFSDLYTAYSFWCKETGRKSIARNRFIKELRATKQFKEVRRLNSDNKREQGLFIKAKEDKEF
jgi:putative DNA primase/helicase